jgi:hypothetical protein
VTAATVLAAPGSPGLMDEAIYQQRADAYLRFATAAPHVGSPVGVAAHLARASREPDYAWAIDDVTVASFADTFAKIDEWRDTRDFDLMSLHWVLALGQGDSDSTRLSPDVFEAIHQRIVANRYRYDDPLPDERLDNLWFWSENHIIINKVIEYLGGQRYPDDTFSVTGLTGAEHMARAKPDILEWVRERGQLGFFEWHSNVYMLKNITPLHLLAEQADDPELVQAAAMALSTCACWTWRRTPGRLLHRTARPHLQEDKLSSLTRTRSARRSSSSTTPKRDYQSETDGGATFLPSARATGHRNCSSTSRSTTRRASCANATACSSTRTRRWRTRRLRPTARTSPTRPTCRSGGASVASGCGRWPAPAWRRPPITSCGTPSCSPR